jgi:hypothetical protein
MPTSCTLIRARELTESKLTDTCTIYAPPVATFANKGEAPDADYPDDWTEFATDVPCRVSETRMTGRESEGITKMQSAKPYDIYLPSSTARPSAKYRIRVTSQGNRDFEIVHPVKTTDMVLLRIECVEVL